MMTEVGIEMVEPKAQRRARSSTCLAILCSCVNILLRGKGPGRQLVAILLAGENSIAQAVYFNRLPTWPIPERHIL